ncbi:MAG: polyphenol oxidase family protein [Elusimicrobiaceae bacterium]|nr:polyphenol oxidase family protein [Elusimicrobiaceae bacterium]
MENIKDIFIKNIPIKAGTTTTSLGDMRVLENRNSLFKKLAIPSFKVLSLKQIHSADIVEINTHSDIKTYSQKPADGWLLATKNCVAYILTADCVPLFLFDKTGEVIGLAHCGWKGVVKKLPQILATKIINHKNFTPPLSAHIAPHINACCFEVKKDCHKHFNQKNIIKKEGKIFVNLEVEIVDQLKAIGISKDNISSSNNCTMCEKNKYFSFRRDGKLESQMSFIINL